LTHQRSDGSIGPEKNRDWWPIMLKVLTQYHEVTGDPAIGGRLEKIAFNPLPGGQTACTSPSRAREV
jgi:hypothetical protein